MCHMGDSRGVPLLLDYRHTDRQWGTNLRVHGRYHSESRDRRLRASTPSLGLLFALLVSVVAFLVALIFTAPAAQAQGLLDGAQGALQETAGAPSAPAPEQQAASATVDPTQQTTESTSAPASEPVASEPVQDQAPVPIQQQAAPVHEQAIEPVTGATGQTTDPAPGAVQERVEPAVEPVLEPAGQTTGAAIETVETVAHSAEPVSRYDQRDDAAGTANG